MSEREWEAHEVYIDHVNELMAKDGRKITGVVTTQHDEDDDINEIKIKIAPSDDDDDGR